jgi:LysR family glycine cleavage system transcriptional activator
MQQRLPSLNALRAFEAAARHLSLTKAARELNVTPAAVSHQIKALEADLGVTLLRRHKGTFVLSEVAQTALPVLRAGFDQLAEAARRLRSDHTRSLLTVSVGPTFASTWLVRRLGGFREAWPEIEVRLDTTDDLADFQRDGVDVAIRFGWGNYPGLRTVRLFEEEIFPVCSPRLVKRGPPLDGPGDIPRHTLLHVEWTPRPARGKPWTGRPGCARPASRRLMPTAACVSPTAVLPCRRRSRATALRSAANPWLATS